MAAGNGLPHWWQEVIGIALLYGAYTGVRGLKSDDLASADHLGRELLRLENVWHINPEHTLNNVLAQVPALAVPACYFYATLHYILTPAVLIWMYRRNPGHYRVARSTILLATVIGLVGFWLLPTTPPRLLAGTGYHDTMADVSGWGWWGGDASAPRGLGGLTNQYAAMPSLHCGWALWCGYLLARFARHRAVRVIGACYPVMTTLVVMSTGNHYFLDAVGGFVDLLLAVMIVLLVRRALPRRPRLTPAAVEGTGRPQATGQPVPSSRRPPGGDRPPTRPAQPARPAPGPDPDPGPAAVAGPEAGPGSRRTPREDLHAARRGETSPSRRRDVRQRTAVRKGLGVPLQET
ncbi:phosphatase PAP2 family protein [Pseudofrankia sp. BMG5.36]|uniref:phosphatase PAP2 family protein n=1 Tax=Pseudofrankia sp. BMG5.36 TaxID=1834512 RepID=UPI0008DA5028|nr:phosphatase PAP2 family protein [Pseudofrankia sp. BMG5.36]OHV73651.1 hypothetical protein BCD48_33285 [Pseudofrankia sp. BMG5.36]